MDTTRSAITIGVFDGVHLGHRALLERARARAGDGPVLAMAFDPHPRAVLRPDAPAPPPLTTFDRRADLLLDAGADEVLRLEPTPELLALAPEAFVDQMLMPHAPAAVVEGPDFRFGARRAGGVDTLAELGRARGFAVEVAEPVEVDLHDQSLVRASSSIARWLVSYGRVADAARVLGRPYELAGAVVRGDRRGRTIGFPTANIEASTLRPAEGVYACLAVLPDGRSCAAAANIGSRPTFDGTEPRVEAHLIDAPSDGDAIAGLPEYGWQVRLQFQAYLRDQVRFGGVDALAGQLARDRDRALRVIESLAAYREDGDVPA